MKGLFFILSLSCILGAAPPQVVIFDYGGVIADIDRKPLLHFLADSLNIPYKTVKKDFARDRLYKSIDEPLSFWQSYANRELPLTWKAQLQQQKGEVVHPTPGMDNLVEQLKAAGLRVALLSNTEKARSVFLKNLGGYQPFHTVILSCDVGVAKPNPKIFKIALKQLDLDASQCLFIDDKKRNVDTAKKLGMDGIVFQSKEHLIEELKKREIALK